MTYRRAIPPLILAAIVGIYAPQGAATVDQATQSLGRANAEQAPRKLRREPGKPIDDRLQAADKEVEVVDAGTEQPLRVRDEFGRALESLTKAYDLVAVVRITELASELTADRSWIRATVDADIIEVLKSGPDAPRPYATGDHITFKREGGSVQIDRKIVKARVAWARNLDERQTYLVFGGHSNGELDIPLDAVYQVVGQRLRSVVDNGPNRDDIEKDTLNGLRERVKRVLGAKY